MNAPRDIIPPVPRALHRARELVIENVSRRRFLQQTSALGGLVLGVGFPAIVGHPLFDHRLDFGFLGGRQLIGREVLGIFRRREFIRSVGRILRHLLKGFRPRQLAPPDATDPALCSRPLAPSRHLCLVLFRHAHVKVQFPFAIAFLLTRTGNPTLAAVSTATTSPGKHFKRPRPGMIRKPI